MVDLPETLPGHWSTAEGRDMAVEYSGLGREHLAHGHQSDFELANSVFLVGRNDLGLIGLQTAAKERIRWLSVQLAIALAKAVEAGFLPGDHVRVPTSDDEAAMMVLLGERWLRENAPHRLRADTAGQS
jgi:hypothetical protein